MPWEKLSPWDGIVHIGCATCSPIKDDPYLCRLDRCLAVGFGDVTVMRDGQHVYSEMTWLHEHGDVEEYPSLADYEAMAAADPDHDWRVHFFGPMHEEEYQRQGLEAWVLIRSGQGFA